MKVSPTKKSDVFAKTDGHCAYCGDIIDPFKGWSIDHAIPQVQGGSNELSNLFPSCRSCNSSKKDRNVREYNDVCRSRALRALDNLCYFINCEPRMHWTPAFRLKMSETLCDLSLAIDNSDTEFFADNLFCEAELRDKPRAWPWIDI